ncbi:hypothetical protein GCM10009727_74570 [Actinomadura napierensis]|uniref:PPE domain-containing protein n=1 Tax=Actinomadura napierensis TaxID=267854 RepID=A0ABN3AED0_9ACTN
MTNDYVYPMRDGAPGGSPGRYDRTAIVQYLRSSDPGAVTDAGEAYLRFAGAYEKLTARLAQIGHDLNDAWTGTDASAAQEQMRDLWASSHTIGAASRDFGTAVERHGSEYLAWYKAKMPQPKDDAEARSWMQGANERITETWSAIPPSISTSLSAIRIGHGPRINPVPAGGPDGSGVRGSTGGPEGTVGGVVPGPSGTGGPGGPGAPGNASPSSSGGTPGDPALMAPPGGPDSGALPGSTPSSPGVGQNPEPGTNLSGVHPPGTGDPNGGGTVVPGDPASPSTSPLAPVTGPGRAGPGASVPGLPGFVPPRPGEAGLPDGAAIGAPKGGYSFKGGTLPEAEGLGGNGSPGSGRIRDGVIGRGRVGPAAAQADPLPEAGTARSGPAAMGPMTGGTGSAQRDRERERRSWAGEDPGVWDDDIETSPSVLGTARKRPEED